MSYLTAIIDKIRSIRRGWLDTAEEWDEIWAYDEAKASGDELIPFEQAVAKIERSRPGNTCFFSSEQ